MNPWSSPSSPDGEHARDYEVGYGRPPRSTRFKPGQSGNPGGRPKRDPNRFFGERQIFQDVFQTFEELVPVSINGETKEIPIYQAILRQLALRAAKGEGWAIRQALTLHTEATRGYEAGLAQSMQTLINMEFSLKADEKLGSEAEAIKVELERRVNSHSDELVAPAATAPRRQDGSGRSRSRRAT